MVVDSVARSSFFDRHMAYGESQVYCDSSI